jgi:hypothetical protein
VHARTLDVSVHINGQTLSDLVAHSDGASTGSIEIDFPGTYPVNAPAVVVVTALDDSGAVLGVGQAASTLSATCTRMSITVDPIDRPDLAGTTPDLAYTTTPDLYGITPDLAYTVRDMAYPTTPDLYGIPSCPATLVFRDGLTHDLAFGPHNKTLVLLQAAPNTVTNYEGDVVFQPGALQSTGQFASGAPQTLGPSDGTKLYPWMGEVALVPTVCKGTDVTGQTVSVDYFVPLVGAVAGLPPSGAFLGSYAADGSPTYYADAVDTSVVSTLADFTLTHKFTAQEAADVAARGLFLRVYALDASESIMVHLFVESIRWQ